MQNNYVVVHVWIGHIDQHLDVPEKYGVFIRKGVPELAVLTLLTENPSTHKKGNQSHACATPIEAASLTEFLDKWKKLSMPRPDADADLRPGVVPAAVAQGPAVPCAKIRRLNASGTC